MRVLDPRTDFALTLASIALVWGGCKSDAPATGEAVCALEAPEQALAPTNDEQRATIAIATAAITTQLSNRDKTYLLSLDWQRTPGELLIVDPTILRARAAIDEALAGCAGASTEQSGLVGTTKRGLCSSGVDFLQKADTGSLVWRCLTNPERRNPVAGLECAAGAVVGTWLAGKLGDCDFKEPTPPAESSDEQHADEEAWEEAEPTAAGCGVCGAHMFCEDARCVCESNAFAPCGSACASLEGCDHGPPDPMDPGPVECREACDSTQTCVAGECLPPKETACGVASCSGGNDCIRDCGGPDTCAEAGSSCCGGSAICDPTEHCVEGGTCCPVGEDLCNGSCCPSGGCMNDGMCLRCGEGELACGSSCCPAGECQDGVCYACPAPNVRCPFADGTSACLPPDSSCCHAAGQDPSRVCSWECPGGMTCDVPRVIGGIDTSTPVLGCCLDGHCIYGGTWLDITTPCCLGTGYLLRAGGDPSACCSQRVDPNFSNRYNDQLCL